MQWVDAFIAVGLSFDARTLARLQAHSDIIRRAPRQRISVMLTVEDGIDVDHDSAADATLNSALHAKVDLVPAYNYDS